MAAMGGMALFIMMLACGFTCIIPAAAALIGCGIYKKRTGKTVKLILRLLLWGVLIVGITIMAVPAMYLFLIVSNW